MSRSDVSICNMALGFLGADLMISLGDGTTEANLCTTYYEPARDALLELRDWSFARKIVRMVPSATPPDFGFTNYFVLPADLLTIRRVGTTQYFNDISMPWERHSDQIAADAAVIYCKYTRKVVDPLKFSELFSLALAARLATYMAMPLTQDRMKLQDMNTLLERYMMEAQSTDGMQEPQEKLRKGPLINLRRTGVYPYDFYNVTS